MTRREVFVYYRHRESVAGAGLRERGFNQHRPEAVEPAGFAGGVGEVLELVARSVVRIKVGRTKLAAFAGVVGAPGTGQRVRRDVSVVTRR